MTTINKAYGSGYEDGVTRVEDAAINGEFEGENAAEVVASWFSAGQVLADEALINACTTRMLADVLGLSVEEIENEGEAYSIALTEYNHGFEAGARAAIATVAQKDEITPPTKRASEVRVIWDRDHGSENEGFYFRIYGEDAAGEPVEVDSIPPWLGGEADGADDRKLRQLALRACKWEGFAEPDPNHVYIER